MSNEAKKLIFTIILFVLIGSGLFLFNQNNESRKTDLFQLRKSIKTYNQLPPIEDIEKRIELIKSEKEKIEPFLFDKDRPVFFIEQVEALAFANEVDIFVENAESFNYEKFGGGIRINVSAEGSQENITNFLKDIEGMKKEVSVDSLRLSRVNTGNVLFWRTNFILTGKTD